MPVVVHVEAMPSHALFVMFDDGSCRVVDVEPLLPADRFDALRDEQRFGLVAPADDGGVAWPSGDALSAATLYAPPDR